MKEKYISLPFNEDGTTAAPKSYIARRVLASKSKGKIRRSTTKDAESFLSIIEDNGFDKEVIRAIFEVESAGYRFVNGLSVIRFEPHVFLRRYTAKKLGTKNSTKADRISYGRTVLLPGMPNHPGQKVERHGKYGTTVVSNVYIGVEDGYKRFSNSKVSFGEKQRCERAALELAASLDRGIAYESTSYGAGQIMGFNYGIVGFQSAYEMMRSFDASRESQDIAMLKFLVNYPNKDKVTGMTLADAVRNADFHVVAKLYNGDTSGKYASKLASAFNKRKGVV